MVFDWLRKGSKGEQSLESIAEETQEIPKEMLNRFISRRGFLKMLIGGAAAMMLPKEAYAKNTVFMSPLGGLKKPKIHECYTDTPQNKGAGYKRICPFDRYAANRSNGRTHNALDVYCSIGTPLYPIKPGIVTGAGEYYLLPNGSRGRFFPANGQSVKIQTEDGFIFIYIHLSKVNVKIGQRVSYNTVVGLSGITGNGNKENPHVHIVLRKNGVLVDPYKYLSFLD